MTVELEITFLELRCLPGEFASEAWAGGAEVAFGFEGVNFQWKISLVQIDGQLWIVNKVGIVYVVGS